MSQKPDAGRAEKLNLSMPHKIADPSLAELGHKEMQLSENEMPGLMELIKKYGEKKPLKGFKITGSLHMTIQTAMLIKTLHALGADLRWASCNIFSTQDQAAAAIAESGMAKVFAWKGETLESVSLPFSCLHVEDGYAILSFVWVQPIFRGWKLRPSLNMRRLPAGLR